MFLLSLQLLHCYCQCRRVGGGGGDSGDGSAGVMMLHVPVVLTAAVVAARVIVVLLLSLVELHRAAPLLRPHQEPENSASCLCRLGG